MSDSSWHGRSNPISNHCSKYWNYSGGWSGSYSMHWELERCFRCWKWGYNMHLTVAANLICADCDDGPVQCYWCWSWQPRMFRIQVLEMAVHGLSRHLCDDCLVRYLKAERPPWKPDGIDRRAAQIKLSLGIISPKVPELTQMLAEFEITPFVP